MHYFNIHRHSPAKDLEETAIINIFPGQDVFGEYLYSIGIHPWHIKQSLLKEDIDHLLKKSVSPLVLAIGECGLDRACDVSFDLQLQVFRAQSKIAETLKKPLIIHSVRAYPELISEKKTCRTNIPWIIHGFRGNQETASQLLNHGFYLSFGEALMNARGVSEILASVPGTRYFLETDESDIGIHEIYGRAATILNTDIDSIILQQWKNAVSLNLFGVSLVE